MLEARLRNALAATCGDSPRPLCDLELPARVRHLLPPEKIANLRPAAVLIPVVNRQHGLQVIFTVRSGNLRYHAGQISFPGGSAESVDANAIATALRESHEEIQLAPEEVEVIGFLDDYPTITGFRITPVVGILTGAATTAADRIEVDEVFEVPLAYLANKQNYEKQFLQREENRVPYYALTYKGYRIWGATAGMLVDLNKKLASQSPQTASATGSEESSA